MKDDSDGISSLSLVHLSQHMLGCHHYISEQLHMSHYSIYPSSFSCLQRSQYAAALCHLAIKLQHWSNDQSSVSVIGLHICYVFELLPKVVLDVSGCQQHND